jgi:putative membrane protein insertion efficiency factor
MQRILILLIQVYRYTLSPVLGQRCRFEPSCSMYAMGALREHGVIRGSGLAAWRLLRCNPFNHGGYDPVPPPHTHTAEHRHG